MDYNNHRRKQDRLEPTETLRKMLGDMATVYNDGSPVDVAWTGGVASADTTGTTINMNTDTSVYGKRLGPAEQFAILADTASHEVEHIRESDLASKGDFMEANGDASRLAGAVINILEDQYIDRTRIQRWPGLAPVHALGTELIFDNDDVRPPMGDLDSVSHQLIEGLTQLAFVGRVKGIADADGRVQDFLAWADDHIEAVRYEDDPSARRDIAQTVFDRLHETMPDHEKAREYIESHIADLIRDMVEQMDDIPPGATECGEPQGESEPIDADPDDIDGQPGEGEPTDGEDGEPTDGDADDGQPGEGESDDSDGDGEGADGDDAESDGDSGGDAEDAGDGEGADGDTDDDADGADSDTPSPGSGGSEGGQSDKIDELIQRDEDDFNQHGDAADIESARESFEEKVDDLRRQEAETPPEVDYEKKRQVAEARAEDLREWKDDSELAPGLRKRFERENIAADIEEALSEFTTADLRVPSTDGYDLNMPAVVDYLAGDTEQENLYVQMEQFEVGDRVVGVALDMSGSMDDDEADAKLAMASFAHAAETIGDTFVAASYSGTAGTTYLATPDDEFDWDILDAAHAAGGTPTASGMHAVQRMVEEVTAREKMLVVVTDGGSSQVAGGLGFDLDAGSSNGRARQQVRLLTKSLREQGWLVMGVGIGEIEEYKLDDQFGDDGWVKTDVANLADVLIDIYRAQMGSRR